MSNVPGAPTKSDLQSLISGFAKNDESQARLVNAGWMDEKGRITSLGHTVIDHALSYGVRYPEEEISGSQENLEYFKPQNTLQQDLFLLAKNHYGYEVGRLKGAAILISQHVVVALDYIKQEAVLHWLLKEFVEPGLIMQKFDRMSRTLMEAGRWPHTHQSYYATLIVALLDEVMRLRVRSDDGTNLMPFEIPEIDPRMAKLLKKSE